MISGSAATVWLRSPPPSCNKMMFPLPPAPAPCPRFPAREPACRIGSAASRCGSIFCPMIRYPISCAIGQLRHFFRIFRLVVDSIRRTEQNRLDAEGAFDQPLRQIQFPTNLCRRNFVKMRMRVGVIADLVAFRIFAFQNLRPLVRFDANHKKRRRNAFSLSEHPGSSESSAGRGRRQMSTPVFFGRAKLIDIVRKRVAIVLFGGE